MPHFLKACTDVDCIHNICACLRRFKKGEQQTGHPVVDATKFEAVYEELTKTNTELQARVEKLEKCQAEAKAYRDETETQAQALKDCNNELQKYKNQAEERDLESTLKVKRLEAEASDYEQHLNTIREALQKEKHENSALTQKQEGVVTMLTKLHHSVGDLTNSKLSDMVRMVTNVQECVREGMKWYISGTEEMRAMFARKPQSHQATTSQRHSPDVLEQRSSVAGRSMSTPTSSIELNITRDPRTRQLPTPLLSSVETDENAPPPVKSTSVQALPRIGLPNKTVTMKRKRSDSIMNEELPHSNTTRATSSAIGVREAPQFTSDLSQSTPDPQLDPNMKRSSTSDFKFIYSPPRGPRGSSTRLQIRGRSKSSRKRETGAH